MRTSIIAILLLWDVKVNAQLYGIQWVLGFSTSVLDFRNADTVTNYPIQPLTPFTLTNANICDESGNLLYFTNGIYIDDKNGNLLENGDSLSPCPYTDAYRPYGLNIQQAVIFLPKPGDSRYYYLFHSSNDTLNDGRPGKIYYSLIDKEGNSGLGAVVEKNVPIISGVVLRDGGMTACKHANGRDYWLVKGASVKNQFYKFLVKPDSILGPYMQTIGPTYPLPFDNAYSKFSQDGSKYVTVAIEGYVLVMDFDRCSGEFSNPVTIYNNASDDPVHNPLKGGVAVEFSPSGRFVYVSDRVDMNQYDLWATDIQDSARIYTADSTDFFQMDMLQFAPNGKIYGSTWNGGGYFLHVINKPDEKGDSCGFVYGGIMTLTDNSDNLPNMVNYRLGPLAGSGCDTVLSLSPSPLERDLMRLQPNPADKYVYVEMPMQGDYELQLLNDVGQVIDKKQTRQVDIFDTEALPAGVYFVKAIDKKNSYRMAVQKVVVGH